ncbi:hypothetical protein [Undibacterium sp. Ji49W]|uniref:hypothetical protein n=1 Tax=Undibacterium sp. Ji49W TaxID=3413040 RepID=UPI003BF40DF1
MNREKSVSLTLRGFDRTAQDVASLIGVNPTRLGNRGEPVRPSVRTLLTRSYVQYSMSFPSEYSLCDMLPDFLVYMGGVSHLWDVQSQVQPEFFEFHFDLPVKKSEESQEGYFSTKDVADIFQLRASISLGFF